MLETGTVIDVKDGKATVLLEAGASCSTCRSCAERESGRMEIVLDAPPGLHPGQRVSVEVGPQNLTWSILLTFVLPTVGLVAGMIVGHKYPLPVLGKDLSSAAFGFAFLIAGLATTITVDRLWGSRKWPPPKIVSWRDAGAPPTDEADNDT